MDRDKYEDIFVRESARYLDELENLRNRAENERGNVEIWDEIHSRLHSIHGMARALSFENIVALSHGMETWCGPFRSGRRQPGDQDLQTLSDGSGLLRDLVVRRGKDAGEEGRRRYHALLERFLCRPGPSSG